jgi:uncharacterized protein HemX
VTHEELRALLPAYAAGALDDEAFQVVRAHLVGGCALCLNDMFERPVGLPRSAFRETPAPPAAPAAAPAVPATPPSRHAGLVAAVVALALALAAAVCWMVIELRQRATAEHGEAAAAESRLAEAEVARVGLAVRVEALEHALAAAKDETSR